MKTFNVTIKTGQDKGATKTVFALDAKNAILFVVSHYPTNQRPIATARPFIPTIGTTLRVR